MKRYVTALNWGMCSQQVQREKAKGCLDLAVMASKDHPPPSGFDLLIAKAPGIWGTVLLLIVEPGYDGVPQKATPYSSPISWLWDRVDEKCNEKWKWDDSNVLWDLWNVDQPLNWYPKELSVLEVVHIPGTHMNLKDTRDNHDVPQVAMYVFALNPSGKPGTTEYSITSVKQSAAILKQMLALVSNVSRDSTHLSNGTFAFLEGVLMNWGDHANAGTFKFHCARSSFLTDTVDARLSYLLASRLDDQVTFDPWVVLVRADPGSGLHRLNEKLSTCGLREYLGGWNCPEHYADADNFLFVGREMGLITSVFVRLEDHTYHWPESSLFKLNREEMAELGLKPMSGK